jgi:hypothetical protein
MRARVWCVSATPSVTSVSCFLRFLVKLWTMRIRVPKRGVIAEREVALVQTYAGGGSANREGDWSSPVYIFRPCRHTISYTMPHEKSILWYLYLYFLPLDRIA